MEKILAMASKQTQGTIWKSASSVCPHETIPAAKKHPTEAQKNT